MKKQAALTLVILLAGGTAFGLQKGRKSPRSFWKAASSYVGGSKSQPGKRPAPAPSDSIGKSAQSFDFEREPCSLDRTGGVCPVHSPDKCDNSPGKASVCNC